MGYYCTVPQCTSLAGKTKNVKFHRFPRDVVLADKWNTILKRGKPYTKYSKVCSLHFTQSDYNVTTMGQWKTLSKDAIPSQNLPKLNPDGTVMVIRKSRTVKYKEVKKEDISGEKAEKCLMSSTIYANHSISDSSAVCSEQHDPNLAYRLQTLNSIANNISPTQMLEVPKTEKQDAIMQTDPIQSEEDDTQPNNTYADVHELDYYQKDYEKKPYQQKDDYIPQTNEEYNKEAEKYALERKSHAAYDKVDSMGFQKVVDYPKANEVYYDKYSRQDGYIYQNGYTDSAEMLRNQQHNLQMLQEPHRINENQNFFNENHIKQEVDVKVDEEKFVYEGNKEAIDNSIYTDSQRRLMQQQRLLEQIQQQVKQEPDANGGCDNVMQPQGSPYYQTEPTSNVTGGYYEQISRPGPELLIAKQNALAAHTQLWQNTMKRPFFYSETPPYNDLTRRLLRERLSSHLNLKDNSAPAPEPRPLSSDEHHRAGELGLIPEDLGYNKDSSVM